MKKDDKLTRRELLVRTASAGAMTVGAGVLLAACEPKESTPQAAGAAADGEIDEICNDPEDLAALSETEIKQREALNYTDESPKPDQFCSNCQLFVEPASGKFCGGCNVLKGPVSPDGWCTAWVKQAVG